MQNIKNKAVNTSKLSTEMSHFLDAHNFSYCPNPKYELWGFGQYEKLWASRKWLISVDNLLVFTALF